MNTVIIIAIIYAAVGRGVVTPICGDHLAESHGPYDIALCMFAVVATVLFWPVVAWERKE